MSISVLSLAILLLGVVSHTAAATYYVAKTGGGSTCSQASPCLTIAAGLQAMNGGDTLIIGEGTYTERIGASAIPSGTSVAPTVIKAAQRGDVILRPTSTTIQHVIEIGSTRSYITLDGLVVDGTNTGVNSKLIKLSATNDVGPHHIVIQFMELRHAHDTSCLQADGSFHTIRNTIIHDCKATGTVPDLGEHGIYWGATDSTLENLTVYDYRGYGIQIYPSTSHRNVVRNSVFIGSRTRLAGDPVAQMRNTGITLYSANNLLYNNLIVDHVDNAVDLRNSNNALINVVMWNNAGGGIQDQGSGTTASHNLCSGHSSCAISTNPLFKNAAAGDYHPTATSPTRDRGLCLAGLPRDKDGITRPQGAGCDIGPYEFTTTTGPQPTPGSLVARYTFEAGTGTTVADTGTDATAHTGTWTECVGDACWGTGIVGSSSGLFDLSRAVEVTTTTGLKPTAAMAISAWLNITATGVQNCDAVSMGGAFVLRIRNNGRLECVVNTAAGLNFATSALTPMLSGVNRHAVCTYDGVTLKTYLDNAEAASTPITGAISHTLGSNLQIGRNGEGGTLSGCQGRMDQVYVLDGFCTPTCVENLFNEQVPAAAISVAHSQFFDANAPEGQIRAALDTSITQEIGQPIGFRQQLVNNGASATEHFRLFASINSTADEDYVEVTDTCGAVCFHDDTQVSMGQATTNLMAALAGYMFTPGRFVERLRNTSLQTILGTAQETEWEARVVSGPTLTNGDVIRLRFHREGGNPLSMYAQQLTWTIVVPAAPAAPASVWVGVGQVGGGRR